MKTAGDVILDDTIYYHRKGTEHEEASICPVDVGLDFDDDAGKEQLLGEGNGGCLEVGEGVAN